MAKRIADKTFQISFRIDREALDRVDAFREDIRKKTGMEPQRSDMMRQIVDFGIDEYEKQKERQLARANAKKSRPARAKKRARKSSGSSAPSTSAEASL